jgi:hypothetical protein
VKKFLIFIVSFNAERHIASVFSRIPYDRLPEGTELLLIDDASNDSAFVGEQEVVKKMSDQMHLTQKPCKPRLWWQAETGLHFFNCSGF